MENINKLEEEILKLKKKRISYDEINIIINNNKNIADLLKNIASEISENNIVNVKIEDLSNNPLVNKFIKIYLKTNEYIYEDIQLDKDRGNMDTFHLFTSYFDDYKLLTKEEEIELARKYKQGDEEAREKLIYSNLRLVTSIAKTFYANDSLTLEDYIQEGNRGLMKAVERYDPERDVKFSTYATWWIKQYIISAIDFKSKTINLHSYATRNQLKLVTNLMNDYFDKYNSYPSVDYISEKTGINKNKILDLFPVGNISSLDAEFDYGDSKTNLYESLVSDDNVEENYIKEDEKKYIDNLIQKKLSRKPIYIAVVKLRYGFDFNEPLYVKMNKSKKDVILSSNYLTGSQINEITNKKIADENQIYIKSHEFDDLKFEIVEPREHLLGEVGEIFDLSKERVRQIQVSLLEKLRITFKKAGYQPNNYKKGETIEVKEENNDKQEENNKKLTKQLQNKKRH